jgi:hypothetical protein
MHCFAICSFDLTAGFQDAFYSREYRFTLLFPTAAECALASTDMQSKRVIEFYPRNMQVSKRLIMSSGEICPLLDQLCLSEI